MLLKSKMDLPVQIEKDEAFIMDRSMNSQKFRALTGFTPPSWEEMIQELTEDKTPYDQWHSYKK